MLTIDSKEHSIVLVGSFNPLIFKPNWFSERGLLNKTETESATVKIIHPDVVDFVIEWAQIQVFRDRFMIRGEYEDKFELLKDLVCGTFDLLGETPLKQMGINLTSNHKAETVEQWHKLGHFLTPKEIWKPLLQNPGMKTITIRGERDDGYKGHIDVKVEPNQKKYDVKKNEFGVLVNINDHLEIGNQSDEAVIDATEIMKMLREQWQNSVNRSDIIVSKIINLV